MPKQVSYRMEIKDVHYKLEITKWSMSLWRRFVTGAAIVLGMRVEFSGQTPEMTVSEIRADNFKIFTED